MIAVVLVRLAQLEERFERLLIRVWALEERLRTAEEEIRRLGGF
jgi:hypothetical protein